MHFLHRVRLSNCHTMQRVFILGNGCWRHAVPSGIHLRFRARFFCDDDTTISTPYDVCITSLRANVCVIFLATRYNLITLVCQIRISKSFVYDHSCNSFDCLIPIPHAVQGGPKFSIHIALLQGLNALQISSTAMVLRATEFTFGVS